MQTQELKSKLRSIKGVSILVNEDYEIDPTKLCIKVEGITGSDVRDILRNAYKIDPETFNE